MPIHLPGRPFERIGARLEGLLAGTNPMFNLGVGLLASSGPRPVGTSSFGTRFGEAMQFAATRQQQAMANEFTRLRVMQALAEQQRQAQAGSALAALARELSTPTGAPTEAGVAGDALAAGGGIMPPQTQSGTLPPALARIVEILAASGDLAGASDLLVKGTGLLDTRESASPIGKLFDDLEAAEIQGNVARVQGLRAIIDAELRKASGEGEERLTFDDIRAARNDVLRDSRPFLEQQRAYQGLLSAVNDPSPAGDLAIVFGTLKILDPGSIVREGEVQLTQGAGTLAQRVAGTFTRVFSGERLTEGQRQDFLRMARNQFRGAYDQQLRLIEDYREFAERNNLRVDDIVPSFVQPLDFDFDSESDDREEPTAGARFDAAVGRAAEALFGQEEQPVQQGPVRGRIARGPTVDLGNGVTLRFLD